MADKGTEATIAPFLRQIEQLHRLGSTIPSGKSSSSTTDPQWHEALCFARITVGPTFLIMAQHILVLHNNEVERRAGDAGINQSIFPQSRHRGRSEAAGRAFAAARGQGAAACQLRSPYFSQSVSRLSRCAIALGRCTVTT
jgi:hypothetical protein